jgi:MoxR-like ATPase
LDTATTASIEDVATGLGTQGYVAARPIALALWIAERLAKPILVEGPAGVGKTELARAIAAWRGLPLHRLQCHEGLDETRALYEWKYGKQLLYTQILKDRIGPLLGDAPGLAPALAKLEGFSDLFFSENFLEPRPLLAALREPSGAVLLIDEVDKADEAFEAFLLELLADHAVTIPEIGTIRAAVPPIVLLTSNGVRELGDALKRRCLHLHIGLPAPALEARIVAARLPGIGASLLRQVVLFVRGLRALDLKKLPSVSETIDWARALTLLHAEALEPELVRETLNLLLKHEADIEAAAPELAGLALRARRDAESGMPLPA